MNLLKVGGVISLSIAALGCSRQYISETRMGYAPPKPETCDVKVVNVPMAELSPGGQYEILGNLVVQATGSTDPFNEELLSQLRPRVCKMGGEEISLGMSSSSTGGSATIYNVLKKKGGAAPAAEPTAAPDSSAAPTP